MSVTSQDVFFLFHDILRLVCLIVVFSVTVIEITDNFSFLVCNRIVGKSHKARCEGESTAGRKRVNVCIKRFAQCLIVNQRAAELTLIIPAAAQGQFAGVFLFYRHQIVRNLCWIPAFDAEFQLSWGTVIRTVPSRSGAFKVVIRPEVA